jgi:subtilisin
MIRPPSERVSDYVSRDIVFTRGAELECAGTIVCTQHLQGPTRELRVICPGPGDKGVTMRDRLSLLLAMGVAMLFACAGLVLAQPTNPDSEQATEGEDAPASSSDAGEIIPNHYIVVLDEGAAAPAAVASDLAEETGLEPTHVYDDALDGFSAKIPAASVSEVRSKPQVQFVARDRVIEAAKQKPPTGIRRLDADESSTEAGTGSGKVDADIAILDTGIYRKHRDLNISGGFNCKGKEGKKAWSDGNGHGTHVAGTAAARDNSMGVVGVAPGARLWAVRVLNDRGTGSFASLICGIDWVTRQNRDDNPTNNIEIANMSVGAVVPGSDDGDCGWMGDGASARLHEAVCKSVARGVFYTAAAGNERVNLATEVPAAFDQVLTVTAIADFNGRPGGGAAPTCRGDIDDTFANFSNYTTVANTDDVQHSIAAPGTCIRSTWKNGGYRKSSGTSMASPHVAGTAALCIANGPCTAGNPQATLDQLRADAAAQPAEYGFIGDPNTAGVINYYGYLDYAGGY